jgi:hypothetical protein
LGNKKPVQKVEIKFRIGKLDAELTTVQKPMKNF